MISISVVPLIIWIIVGLLNFVNCINHQKCTWFDYWLSYGVLIIALIDNLVEELA